jgi:hypothetical protein
MHERDAVARIAQRHGFSVEAARAMLAAVAAGNGTMAQFDHREFGGAGQWMRGGMIMIGDMFNDALKARVSALCTDLAQLPARESGIARRAQADRWWPAALGTPASSGAQNDARYAYFPDRRRLAIDVGGAVAVYDTLEHRITGFAQQQGGMPSMTFTTVEGKVVDVRTLPVAAADGLD